MATRVLTCEQDYRNELIDALAAFDARVSGAQAAHTWSEPSPCPGWNAEDVVRHVTGNVRTFIATVPSDTAAGAPPRPADDEDLVRGWDRARANALQVLRTCEDPANVRVPLGPREMTITFVIEALLRDVVIHTWDLARAAGGDEILPAHLVTAATAALARMPQHIRERGYFEDALEAPPDATDQIRLLALAGRRA
jgi:uncharacterized protein (TIGR03086 family)